MTRRSLLLAGAAALGATIVPSAALAHPGHDHKVMGTIAAVDGRRITIKTTDGKDVTFAITDTTKLMRDKRKGEAADLKAGLRVVANLGDGAEPLTARELQYSAAATDQQ